MARKGPASLLGGWRERFEDRPMRIDIDDLISTKTIPNGLGVLAHREPTVLAAIDYIRDSRPGVIVETGTQSTLLVHDHGISTLLFAALAEEVGASFFSVDISRERIEAGKRITQGYRVHYVRQDSVTFLSEFQGEIGFLYLDSYDFGPGEEANARKHQLREISAAWPKLSSGACVLLDDCDVQMWFRRELNEQDRQGKSYLSHGFLLEKPVDLVRDAYQRMYIKRRSA